MKIYEFAATDAFEHMMVAMYFEHPHYILKSAGKVIHICICTYNCIYKYVCVCINKHTYIQTNKEIYVNVHIHTHAQMYVYIYICIYMKITGSRSVTKF